MNKEIDFNENNEKNNKSKSKFKRGPNCYFSVDDIEFDDPEYIQYFNKEEILSKQKNQALKEDKNKSEYYEHNYEKQVEIEDYEEETKIDNENNDIKNEINLLNDSWNEKLEILFSQLKNKSIDSKNFERRLNNIIESLDPSKKEKNTERIFLLTKCLVEHYQSLFLFNKLKKNEINNYTIDFKSIQILSSHIYNLTHKYGNKSTRKEPSKYIDLFKNVLKKFNDDYSKLNNKGKKFPLLIEVANLLFIFIVSK
jgi:hypothetical protein